MRRETARFNDVPLAAPCPRYWAASRSAQTRHRVCPGRNPAPVPCHRGHPPPDQQAIVVFEFPAFRRGGWQREVQGWGYGILPLRRGCEFLFLFTGKLRGRRRLGFGLAFFLPPMGDIAEHLHIPQLSKSRVFIRDDLMIRASKGHSGENLVEIRYIFIAKRSNFPTFY